MVKEYEQREVPTDKLTYENHQEWESSLLALKEQTAGMVLYDFTLSEEFTTHREELVY